MISPARTESDNKEEPARKLQSGLLLDQDNAADCRITGALYHEPASQLKQDPLKELLPPAINPKSCQNKSAQSLLGIPEILCTGRHREFVAVNVLLLEPHDPIECPEKRKNQAGLGDPAIHVQNATTEIDALSTITTPLF